MGNEQFYEKVCNKIKNFFIEKEALYFKICNKLKSFHLKKEKMKLRGFNDFNFINLLKGFSDENTHSKIIAEFLNPEGLHYQEELFLEKFFEILNFDKTNIKEWEVYTEFFVEDVTGKGQGRIDIFLRNKKENKFIILENKIYANDQDAQIYRYVEYLYLKKDFNVKNYNDILVLYLTPFKRNISSYSLDNYKIEEECLIDTISNEKKALFKNITYEKEILEWLDKSLKEVENISNLRESIKQYQRAVKHITNKEEDIMNLEEYLKKLFEGDEEDKEILKTLIVDFNSFNKFADKECLKIMEEENINEIIEKIKKYIRKTVIEKIKELIIEKFNNRFKIEDYDFGDKYAPLIIYKSNWKKCNNNFPLLHYALELDKWEYKGLYYGIRKCDKDIPYKDREIPETLKVIPEITNSSVSPWWLSWKWFEYPYNMIKGDEKDFYIEFINEYSNIDNFIEEHYLKPLINYIDMTESFLDNFYKTT